MKFCPVCDNILLVKRKKTKGKKNTEKQEKVLYCPSCGYEEKIKSKKDLEDYTLRQKIDRSAKDKTVILMTSVDSNKITEEEREANEDFFNPDLD